MAWTVTLVAVNCYHRQGGVESVGGKDSGVAMKRSTKASLLSFVLPGAGLWYCGWKKSAIVNLVLAVAIPLVGLTTDFFSEHIQWVLLAVAAGSAGIAHSMSGSRD